ncbi:MAG: tyrosine-type recombinase/integrase [Planctomycetes bacterium]|nr:tyrosine-type recombinase/integrase [Planctomycetota bacterium]
MATRTQRRDDDAETRFKPTHASRRFPPEVLTDIEVRLLMDACGTRPWTAVRNRTLIALLYRSGLRIAEALALRPVDVMFRPDPSGACSAAIRVLCGKGGKARTIGIDVGGTAILTEWMKFREYLGFTPGQPLICTKDGNQMATAAVRRLFPTLAARGGLVRRVHAHGLRHTHASQLREEGLDIGLISKQLGHSSIKTTARYLDHIAPMAVIEAIGKRHW